MCNIFIIVIRISTRIEQRTFFAWKPKKLLGYNRFLLLQQMGRSYVNNVIFSEPILSGELQSTVCFLHFLKKALLLDDTIDLIVMSSTLSGGYIHPLLCIWLATDVFLLSQCRKLFRQVCICLLTMTIT